MPSRRQEGGRGAAGSGQGKRAPAAKPAQPGNRQQPGCRQAGRVHPPAEQNVKPSNTHHGVAEPSQKAAASITCGVPHDQQPACRSSGAAGHGRRHRAHTPDRTRIPTAARGTRAARDNTRTDAKCGKVCVRRTRGWRTLHTEVACLLQTKLPAPRPSFDRTGGREGGRRPRHAAVAAGPRLYARRLHGTPLPKTQQEEAATGR